MDTLTIEGVPGFDGEYPLDFAQRFFDGKELHFIKLETGLRAGELPDAYAAGDYDLVVMMAVIAVWRKTGTKPDMDQFWNAEAGTFTIRGEEETTEDEDESLPPSTEPEPNEIGEGSKPEDGEISNGTSDLPENILHRIGAQD